MVGFCPRPIENILSVAIPFFVEVGDTDEFFIVPKGEVLWIPAAFTSNDVARFKCFEKFVLNKWKTGIWELTPIGFLNTFDAFKRFDV